MHLSPEDRAYLDDRYGRNRKKRWPSVIVAIIIAAGVAWTAWAFWGQIHPKVTSGMTSYDITDEHHVTVTFEVKRDNADVAARCSLKVQAHDHSTVGIVTDKPLPLTTPDNTPIKWEISTTRKAYAVQWVGCTADGQNSPK